MEEIINQFDENGNKHGKWIIGKRFKKVEHYVNGIRHGKICQYITEGKPRVDLWHFYDEDGIMESERIFII